MTANRSLDEFVGGSEPADDVTTAAADDASAPVADDAESEIVDDAGPRGVAPIASTFAWSPEGGSCATCGGSAEERWREGDEMVCADCKEW